MADSGVVIGNVDISFLPQFSEGSPQNSRAHFTTTPGTPSVVANSAEGIQVVGDTEETLDLPSDMNNDYPTLLIQNQGEEGSTVYLEVGFSSGVYSQRLAEGVAILLAPTLPIYLKGEAGASNLRVYYAAFGI